MLDWTNVIGIMILVLTVGAVVAGLMILRDRLLLNRRAAMVDEIEARFTHGYLPAIKDYELDVMDKMMDKICDKIPDVMEKTMNSAKKMMEE